MDNQPLTESAKYHNTLIARAQEILHDPASSAAYRRAATALLRHEGVSAPVEGVATEISRAPTEDMWESQPTPLAPQDPWETIAPAPQPVVAQTPPVPQEVELETNGGLLLGVEDPLNFALAPAPKPDVTPAPEASPDERAVGLPEVHLPIQQVTQDGEPLTTFVQESAPPSLQPLSSEGVDVAPEKEDVARSLRDRLNAFLGRRQKSDELFDGVGKLSDMVTPSKPLPDKLPVTEVSAVSGVQQSVPVNENDVFVPTFAVEPVVTEAAKIWEMVAPKVSTPPTRATGPIDEPIPHIDSEQLQVAVEPEQADVGAFNTLVAFETPAVAQEEQALASVSPAIPFSHDVLDDTLLREWGGEEQQSALPVAPLTYVEDVSPVSGPESIEQHETRSEGIATYRAMLAMLDEISHGPHELDTRQQTLRESIVLALEQAEADIGIVLTESSIVQGWADLLAQSAVVSEDDEVALKQCIVAEVERIARAEVTGGEEPDAEVLWGVWRALTGKSHEHIPEPFTDDPKLLHDVEQELLTRLRHEEHR